MLVGQVDHPSQLGPARRRARSAAAEQSGQLDDHVRLHRQPDEPVLPARPAVGVAERRLAAVVEDEAAFPVGRRRRPRPPGSAAERHPGCRPATRLRPVPRGPGGCWSQPAARDRRDRARAAARPPAGSARQRRSCRELGRIVDGQPADHPEDAGLASGQLQQPVGLGRCRRPARRARRPLHRPASPAGSHPGTRRRGGPRSGVFQPYQPSASRQRCRCASIIDGTGTGSATDRRQGRPERRIDRHGHAGQRFLDLARCEAPTVTLTIAGNLPEYCSAASATATPNSGAHLMHPLQLGQAVAGDRRVLEVQVRARAVGRPALRS